MKKQLLITAVLLLSISSAFAQSKEATYDKIEETYAWLNRQMLEKYFTINMTEEQWAYALKNEYHGYGNLSNMAGYIAGYMEIITGDNKLTNDCRYGKDNERCVDKVKELPDNLKIELNATSMKLYPETFKLAMMSLKNVCDFLGANNLSGGKVGWRPKAASLKIIINIDNGNGQPVVSWNTDGSVATIKMFVGSEAGDWYANMHKGLQKGGK